MQAIQNKGDIGILVTVRGLLGAKGILCMNSFTRHNWLMIVGGCTTLHISWTFLDNDNNPFISIPTRQPSFRGMSTSFLTLQTLSS